MPRWFSITLLSLALVIFFIITVLTVANVIFARKVKKETSLLLGNNVNINNEDRIIEKEDIEELPLPVQKWLERSRIVGKKKIAFVYLKQKAMMRIKQDGPWMPAEAEQYFTVDRPGFLWKARVNMSPLIYLSGMDEYKDGRGYMSIKLLSLIPVVNATGPEVNQGTLLRYLGEMSWFPAAVLNDYIKWEPVDSNSARATMSYGGVTASAVFTFNSDGDLAGLTAKRYMEAAGKYVLRDWAVVAKDYGEFQGIRIPNKLEVIWKLESGDFTWYKVEVTDAYYNNVTD